jgi:hypothetical protein
MVCQEKFTVTMYEEEATPTSEKPICTFGFTVTINEERASPSVEIKMRFKYPNQNISAMGEIRRLSNIRDEYRKLGR